MTLSINSKSYFNEIKEVRKNLLSKYDSFLYPQINNDTGGTVYYHITNENIEHQVFRFNRKFHWREIDEIVTARSLPKMVIRYYDHEKYELKLQTEKDGVEVFYEKIIHPSVLKTLPAYHLNSDTPPLFLVKNRHIIGVCSNPFWEGKRFMANAVDVYNSELIDYNLNFMQRNFIKIKVLSSIQSKIENLDFKLDKRYILSSPYLDKGLVFNIKDKLYAIWKDKKYLYMQVGEVQWIPTIISFNLDELPQEFSQMSILSLIASKINDDSIVNTQFKLNIEKNKKYPIVETLHNTSLIAHDNFVEIDEITNDGNTVFTNIQEWAIIDCFKALTYCISLNTPEMRTYVKGGNSKKIPFNPSTANKYILNKWHWGTNKVRYVYPKRKSNSKKVIHYTKPHLCKFYVKNLKKYKEYNPIEDSDKYSIIKWREGCWKGEAHTYIMGKQVGGYSRKAIAWLNQISNEHNIEIQHAENGGELRVELGNGKYYLVDGYCKDTNTAYEFHGDVFHGNPSVFDKEDKCHPYNDLTAGELLEYTLQKEDNLRKMGFNLVVIWESKWDKERIK